MLLIYGAVSNKSLYSTDTENPMTKKIFKKERYIFEHSLSVQYIYTCGQIVYITFSINDTIIFVEFNIFNSKQAMIRFSP